MDLVFGIAIGVIVPVVVVLAAIARRSTGPGAGAIVREFGARVAVKLARPSRTRPTWIRSTLQASPRGPRSARPPARSGYCRICHHPVSRTARFCRSCGAEVLP